jgi:hypothetical protein
MANVDQAADAAVINQLVDQQVGAQQQQMAAEQQQAAAQQQAMNEPAGDPSDPSIKPTQNENAQATASPTTEGDKSAEDAFTYINVDFGEGDVRTLSNQQVRDTMKRYSDLNYKHQSEIAPHKATLDMMNQIMREAEKAGSPITGDDVYEFMQAAAQAYLHNPQMGGQGYSPDGPQGMPIPKDIEAELSQWEEDNAINLPPMYRNAAAQMNSLQNENAQIKQMLQQLAQNAQGLPEMAQAQQATAQQTMVGAQRELAANNLDMVQQQLGLPDTDSNDFFTYAYERGYTIEDFVDRNLTNMVMSDFANQKASPEMARLREIAQRRQAFTGSMGSQPGMGGAQPAAPNADADFIGSIADQFMKKRNMA